MSYTVWLDNTLTTVQHSEDRVLPLCPIARLH